MKPIGWEVGSSQFQSAELTVIDQGQRQPVRRVTNSNIKVFSPVQLGPYALRNRMVMAPMMRNRAGPGNVPQSLNVEYCMQRSSAGLIITEGAQVAAEGAGYSATPGIHNQEQMAAQEIVRWVEARL